MNPAALRIREQVLRIAHASGHGHLPTCFSVVEMLMSVYDTMRHNPADPAWAERDIFILSKGHAALGLYCTLAHYGYFPIEDVYRFGAFGSNFGCHADRFKVPGIEASTGSLGHGIGLAVGMALGFKIDGNDRQVYTLIGDGESNEGSVWEAVMTAAHLDLHNLTILFDNNHSQTRCQPIHEPLARFRAFGCDAVEVDGHDLEALKSVLSEPRNGPRVVIANTEKGHGCPTLVKEMFAWHRRSPNDAELSQLLEELKHG